MIRANKTQKLHNKKKNIWKTISTWNAIMFMKNMIVPNFRLTSQKLS